MMPSKHLLLALFLLSTCCLGQSIVDFTYSQYDQKYNKASNYAALLNIHPAKEAVQGYNFPEACHLAKKLQENKVDDNHDLVIVDTDDMIQKLKGDFVELLKVSEKIKKKKSNLKELAELSSRFGSVQSIGIVPKNLDELRSLEKQLIDIETEVQDKTGQLEKLVRESMRDDNSNDFALSAVNFEIQSLTFKLQYLRSLYAQAKSGGDFDKVKSKFQVYFSEIKNKFDEDSGLIDDLNEIMKNYNKIGELKTRISNLKGKIEVTNLVIQEKETCVKQVAQIRRFQRNDQQVRALMASLREKKKDRSNLNNKYCEGVVQKLLDRVKKVLLSYDYTFDCATGLEELDYQRKRDEKDLKAAQDQLKLLEGLAGIDQYKIKFQQNRQFIVKKQQELKKFSFPAYSHDPEQIKQLISKAENDLSDAKLKKTQLTSNSATPPVDYKLIHELVTKVKKLKGTYCQQYEKYQAKAQKLWKSLHKYEAEFEYNSKMRGLYEQEINQIRELENTFDLLRNRILLEIK